MVRTLNTKEKKNKNQLIIETIATGNELLDGSIFEKHTQRLATALKPFGLQVARSTVVRDHKKDIQEALKGALKRAKILLFFGGLGPTTDDLTVEAVAEYFKAPLKIDANAKKMITARYKKLGRTELSDGHKKMMLLPKGAKAFMNSAGTAPLIHYKKNGVDVFFIPGPPKEFEAVLQDHLLKFFKKYSSPLKSFLFIYKIFWKPESEINDWMKTLVIPSQVTVGYRTFLPENHLKLEVRAFSEAEAKKIIAPLADKIRQQYGPLIFTEDSKSFEESIVEYFKSKNLKIAVAESCTGGLISSMVTSVSGSSSVFDRGFITYSNESKMELLGVRADTLARVGAVSSETAEEMAKGALKNSKADFALAVTGIAGPTGGTPEKPVGTVYIAVADRRDVLVKRLDLKFDRAMNQKFSAYVALSLLRDRAYSAK